MHFAGAVSSDQPDPMEEWRKQARALGIPVAGLAPHRHLEDWGISGVTMNASDDSRIDEPVVQSATLSRSYTVLRNPDSRDDPVNLADMEESLTAAVDRRTPDDRPAWMVRLLERMRYPMLWEAVQTHWSPTPEEWDINELLTAHVDFVLHNRFRAENGLGDPTAERWVSLVKRDAARPSEVIVDGAVANGVIIDTDPFVFGIAAPLDDKRVFTAVVTRAFLDLVPLEFVSDVPY
jgi:hypothetical protein